MSTENVLAELAIKQFVLILSEVPQIKLLSPSSGSPGIHQNNFMKIFKF